MSFVDVGPLLPYIIPQQRRGKVEGDEKEWQNPPLPRSILLLTEKLRATPNTGVELFRKYDKNGANATHLNTIETVLKKHTCTLR